MFIRLFTLVLLVTALTACNDSNKSEGDSASASGDGELADKLYFFNWGENMNQAILDGFEKEFGVEVVYDTFASNQEMLTKLNSGTVNYDIIVPTDYFLEKMAQENQLLELDMDNIPNFENIEEIFHDRAYDPGNKYSVPYLYGSIGMAYNKAKTGPLTGYADMWNPEFEGHVTAHKGGRDLVTMTLQKLGHDIHEYTDEELEEAKDSLRELDKNVLAYSSEPAAMLINGEAWVSQIYSDQAGIAMGENPDIEYIIPEEGGILWMDNFAIPKTAKNKYTAEVFINYMLRPEISKMLTDEIPSSNPNAAARELMDDDEKNNPASYPEIPDTAVFYQYLDAKTVSGMENIVKEIKVE